jgi:hypothetical protein
MVSPRLDSVEAVWPYDVEHGVVRFCSACIVDTQHPALMAKFLEQKEINTILCRGCPRHFSQTLMKDIPGCRSHNGGEQQGMKKMRINRR